jgi:hypothetical protein
MRPPVCPAVTARPASLIGTDATRAPWRAAAVDEHGLRYVAAGEDNQGLAQVAKAPGRAHRPRSALPRPGGP